MPMAKMGRRRALSDSTMAAAPAQLQRQLAGQLFIGHAAHAVRSKHSRHIKTSKVKVVVFLPFSYWYAGVRIFH